MCKWTRWRKSDFDVVNSTDKISTPLGQVMLQVAPSRPTYEARDMTDAFPAVRALGVCTPLWIRGAKLGQLLRLRRQFTGSANAGSLCMGSRRQTRPAARLVLQRFPRQSLSDLRSLRPDK